MAMPCSDRNSNAQLNNHGGMFFEGKGIVPLKRHETLLVCCSRRFEQLNFSQVFEKLNVLDFSQVEFFIWKKK